MHSGCIAACKMLMLLIVDTVVPESQLQSNTAVTNELFMEGFKLAAERNPGKSLLSCPLVFHF